MTATTVAAYDPAPLHLGLVKSFKATAAILAGEVVAFDDAGASRYVSPATTSLGTPIGVALNSQATVGGPVTVAMQGSVVLVQHAVAETTIDAGHWVTPTNLGGCVKEYDPAIAAHAETTDTGTWPIGFLIEDMAAASKAYMVVNVCPIYAWHT